MKGLRIGLAALAVGIVLLGLLFFPLGGENKEKQEEQQIDGAGEMNVEPGFRGEFPVKYTCDGENISPPVSLGQLPNGTASVALVIDDPDAPTRVFDHWVIWNIPPDEDLEAGVPPKKRLENGAVQGENDFGDIGYGGPCPPSGTHTYRIKAYALDTELNLVPGSTKEQLESAIEGHVLDSRTVKRDYTS